MNRTLKRFTALAITAGLATAPAAAAETAGLAPDSGQYGAAAAALAQPTATIAKACSSGYTHGIINHVHKCLRVGQFCAHHFRRQYHKYGFNCRKQDARGNYHLTYRR
jgi:hypothetical protein